MQVTREDLNSCTIQLTVELDKSEVKDAFDKAVKTIGKSIRLPGFRPGHAPKSLVEEAINPRRLYDEAANHIVQSTLRKVVEEQKLEPDPNARPAVSLKTLDKTDGKAEYVAKIPLPPKVQLGELSGLELEQPPSGVEDAEVEYQVEELRKHKSVREIITDRSVQDGDIAVLNVKVDGEAGDGRNFMTIVGQTFPELDKNLSGMKVEEMKHLTLTFPENFQEKDWAAKTISCIVTVNSANAVKLPPLDEAFARSLQTESMEDLKKRIREQLVHAKARMVREMLSDQALEKLLERSTVEVSDNTWESIAEQRLSETAEEQEKEGKSLEEYAKENGMTLEELVQAWRDKAQLYIKRAFLIREIFTAEKMSLGNADLNEELVLMAEEYNMPPKDLAETLQKNQALEELRFRAISRKVSDHLIQNAKIKEVKPPKPAKAK